MATKEIIIVSNGQESQKLSAKNLAKERDKSADCQKRAK